MSRDRNPKLGRNVRMWLTAQEARLIHGWRDAEKCASKTPYATKADALRAAIGRTLSLKDVPKLNAYCCPTCSKWHLTRMTEEEFSAYQAMVHGLDIPERRAP